MFNYLSHIFYKKNPIIWVMKKRFNSLSHIVKEKSSILWVFQKKRSFLWVLWKKKKVQFSESILWVILEKFKFNSLSHIQKKKGSILCVMFEFLEWVIFLKKGSILRVIVKKSILWVTSKRKEFNSLSLSKKKSVHFFES